MADFGPASSIQDLIPLSVKVNAFCLKMQQQITVSSGNRVTAHSRFKRMLTGCSVQKSWNGNLFHNTLPDSKYITENTNYHCATSVVIKALEYLLLYRLQHYFSMLSPK